MASRLVRCEGGPLDGQLRGVEVSVLTNALPDVYPVYGYDFGAQWDGPVTTSGAYALWQDAGLNQWYRWQGWATASNSASIRPETDAARPTGGQSLPGADDASGR